VIRVDPPKSILHLFNSKFDLEGPSMLLSHRFGSVETLSRARYWLTQLGFEVAQTDEPSHDVSRLTLNVDFSKASAALALIDSIERSDPEGWPANTTPSKSLHAHPSHAGTLPDSLHAAKAGTPIHWQRRDETSLADPVSSKVVEYMLSRWE
jgi:hypothetical protein